MISKFDDNFKISWWNMRKVDMVVIMLQCLTRWTTLVKLVIIVCLLGYCIVLLPWSIRYSGIIQQKKDKATFNSFHENGSKKDANVNDAHDEVPAEGVHDILDQEDGQLNFSSKSTSSLDIESVLLRMRSTSWRFRPGNLRRLRKEIRDSLGMDFLNNAFLTRVNTPLNSSVLFYKILPEGKLPVAHHLWVQLPKMPIFSGRQYKTCSVVGSSGILKGRGCGRMIDNADFVFRMNNAVTSDEFVIDVGNRTNQMSETGKSLAKMMSIQNISSNSKRTCLPNTPFPDELFENTLKSFPKILLVRLPMYPQNDVIPLATKGCRIIPKSKGQLVLWDPRINKKLNTFWYKKGLKLKISSGFFSVTIAVHICKETHVFGFWPFSLSPEGKKVPYHYYDQLITKEIVHDFIEEFRLLLGLHDYGIIKLHVDDCQS